MRSPWQLIKGLVSSGKSYEGGATDDETVVTPDPRVEAREQRNAPQGELEAQSGPNPQSAGDGDETDRQSTSIGADAEPPLPVIQPDPLPLQAAENVAPKAHDQPAPVALVVQAIDGEGNTPSVTTASNQRRVKATQAREIVGKKPIVEIAVVQPVAAKKTAVDEAAELDREIKNLRVHLSAKLLEQNMQLRRMIERYGDK